MEKVHIEKNTVQETLVIPLYGRKLCTERFPRLFQDPKAVELIERLDYDFSGLAGQAEKLVYQFGALEVAMRESDLMAEMKDYLKTHPRAALVNLGCGLDQAAELCAGPENTVYNIDLPDVIAVRDELLPGSERIRNIAADLNDVSWFDAIDSENGACFIAAGVFYYFTTESMKRLLPAMAARFPRGRLAFDAANGTAVRLMLKTWVKQAGVTSIREYFSVSDAARDLGPWLPGTDISSRGYMLGYNDLRDPSVPALFRLLARIGDGWMKMQIVRLDFGERARG